MASLREHIWLAASADVVWKTVGDPLSLQKWVPSVLTSSIEGRLRTLVLKRGGTVVEEILNLDERKRRIQYSVRAGLPVDHHLGTVDVIEAGTDRCLVIYGTDVTPDTIAKGIGAAISGSLQVLGRTFGVAPHP
jgi:hypothetical protein